VAVSVILTLVPAYRWHPDLFATHSRASELAFGLFYGVLLALLIYNLMLFLSVRDPLYTGCSVI
jgi:hypothetical protein